MIDTYEITLDRDALDVTDDAALVDAFLALAADANATFTNVRVVPTLDRTFANDVTVRFDATPSNQSRYAIAYDASDAITVVAVDPRYPA